MRWVETVGPEAVAALENLERTNELTPGGLRPLLQMLLSREARLSVLPAMRRVGARLADLSAAATNAAKVQWVGWQLAHPENPYILDDLRMPPHPTPPFTLHGSLAC